MTRGIWGCILSELKEYTPRPPKKNSGRDFDFPPRPTLKRPKERPAGLSFGILSGVGRGIFGTKDVGTGTGDGGGVVAAIQGSLLWGRRGHWGPGSFGGGIGWVSPCGGRGAARRGHRALRGLRRASSTTRGSRRIAERLRQQPRGTTKNRRKDHQKGPPPRQRLAKRKARKEQLVKFGLCPIPSECSTAYTGRRSAESPARAPAEAALTEQNGLAPRPAARQGAPRARNCAATSVFSFDGSTAVLFLGRQKENGGGIPAGDAPLPPVWGMTRERKLSFLSLLFPQRAAKVRAPAVFSQWSRNAAAAARITV